MRHYNDVCHTELHVQIGRLALKKNYFMKETPLQIPSTVRDVLTYLREHRANDRYVAVLFILSSLAKELCAMLQCKDLVLKSLIDRFQEGTGRFIIEQSTDKDASCFHAERSINEVVDIINKLLFSYWDTIRYEPEEIRIDIEDIIRYANFTDIFWTLFHRYFHNSKNKSIFIGVAEEKKDKVLEFLNLEPIFSLFEDGHTLPKRKIKISPKEIKVYEEEYSEQPRIWMRISSFYKRLAGIEPLPGGYLPLLRDSRWLKILNRLPLSVLKEVVKSCPIYNEHKENISIEQYIAIAVLLDDLLYDLRDTSEPTIPFSSSPHKSSIVIQILTENIGEIVNTSDWTYEAYYLSGEPIMDMILAIYHYLHLRTEYTYFALNGDTEDDKEYWLEQLDANPLAKELWNKCNAIETPGIFEISRATQERLFDPFYLYDIIAYRNIFGQWSIFLADAFVQVSIALSTSCSCCDSHRPCYTVLLAINNREKYKSREEEERLLRKLDEYSSTSLYDQLWCILEYFKLWLDKDPRADVIKMGMTQTSSAAIEGIESILKTILKYQENELSLIDRHVVTNRMFISKMDDPSNWRYGDYHKLIRKVVYQYALQHPKDSDGLKELLNLHAPAIYSCPDYPEFEDSFSFSKNSNDAENENEDEQTSASSSSTQEKSEENSDSKTLDRVNPQANDTNPIWDVIDEFLFDENAFVLPEYFKFKDFDWPINHDSNSDCESLKPEIKEQGKVRFCILINALAKLGYVKDEEANLSLLAYALSGCSKSYSVTEGKVMLLPTTNGRTQNVTSKAIWYLVSKVCKDANLPNAPRSEGSDCGSKYKKAAYLMGYENSNSQEQKYFESHKVSTNDCDRADDNIKHLLNQLYAIEIETKQNDKNG